MITTEQLLLRKQEGWGMPKWTSEREIKESWGHQNFLIYDKQIYLLNRQEYRNNMNL